MNFTVRLPSDRAIGRGLLKVLRDRLNAALRGAAPAVKARLGFVCGKLIEGTPEYASLLNGELLWELGIPGVEARLKEVLGAVASSVEVAAVPVQVAGDRLEGGMVARMLRSDFRDLLGLAAAGYVSGPSGSEINWLDWLVTQGDRVVVYGYDVKFDLSASERARSRTGGALMRAGQGWRVDPRFSGTLEDNFLTRAFNVPEAESLIARVFREEITLRL